MASQMIERSLYKLKFYYKLQESEECCQAFFQNIFKFNR